jgi:hypothetical protein
MSGTKIFDGENVINCHRYDTFMLSVEPQRHPSYPLRQKSMQWPIHNAPLSVLPSSPIQLLALQT